MQKYCLVPMILENIGKIPTRLIPTVLLLLIPIFSFTSYFDEELQARKAAKTVPVGSLGKELLEKKSAMKPWKKDWTRMPDPERKGTNNLRTCASYVEQPTKKE